MQPHPTGHGKVILFGEHSVVYGKTAIAAALQRGASAVAQPALAAQLDIESWQVSITPAGMSPEDLAATPLARAFLALLALYPPSLYPQAAALHVRATVDLPGGAGLGSSAALGVAILAAIDACLGIDRPAALRAEDSLVWERVFHGNPSGVDSAIAAAGGVLCFQRGQPSQTLRLAKPLHLVIASSGEFASTHAMVENVASLYRRDESRVVKILDAIESVTQNGRSALQEGDVSRLGQLMDLNHMLLNTLLVSTPRLEELCAVARQAGAAGAKLTGAGGGGCILAAAADSAAAAAVCAALAPLSQEVFVTTLEERNA